MRPGWLLVALLSVPGIWSGQTTGILRVEISLLDLTRQPVPVSRHALLISDNPPTAAPRRVLTRADGTVEIRLRPGLYTVESDRPVTLLGQAYQWTEMAEVGEGGEVTLRLTAANAEVTPVTAPDPGGAATTASDPSFLFSKWQESVVGIWSPTAPATGFVVDARGLIATSGQAMAEDAAVEVQLSESLKVPGRVLVANPSTDAAVVWVDAGVLANRAPLPLPCSPANAPPLDDGQEVMTLVAPVRRPKDQTWGEVIGLTPRAVQTDLRFAFGGGGGPAFNEAGAVVGLTSLHEENGVTSRRRDVNLIRAGVVCEAITSALSKMAGATPPDATVLPIEPAQPFPVAALEAASTGSDPQPPVVSSSDFDVAFITPPAVHRAQQRSGWTGGSSTRSPEAAARLGLLTDFGAWYEYFVEVPPVLVVRITPKLVEGFWKRLAREAARTQGAVLPPFKDFKTSFVRMQAFCGDGEVVAVHPFLLEHRVSERDAVREGLYVFDAGAFGPHCARVALTLHSEKAPDRGETIVIPANVVERIWQDFAPWRDSGGRR